MMARGDGSFRIDHGVSRTVVLIGRWALKFPTLRYGWRLFLRGLLANMQEREFARAGWPELCPVTFSITGGWLTVMRRAQVMTEDEFRAFDVRAFCETADYVVPCEFKSSSFGWIDGRVVSIDYGN